MALGLVMVKQIASDGSDEAAGLCGYTTETPTTEFFTTEEGTAEMSTTMKLGNVILHKYFECVDFTLVL